MISNPNFIDSIHVYHKKLMMSYFVIMFWLDRCCYKHANMIYQIIIWIIDNINNYYAFFCFSFNTLIISVLWALYTNSKLHTANTIFKVNKGIIIYNIIEYLHQQLNDFLMANCNIIVVILETLQM